MATETKQSNLEKAFDRKNALNLNLTLEQFSELNQIMCDLATEEYTRALHVGFNIAEKYNKKFKNRTDV